MTQLTTAQAMKIATEHHQSGRLADAEAIYRQVLSREPRHAEALQLLGVLACQTGHLTSGIDLLRRSIDIDPNAPDAHNNLSRALTESGQFADAERAARRAIELDPRFADAHNNLGIAFDKLGRSDEAMASFQRSLELDANHVFAMVNLARALTMRGRPDEAITQLRRALALQPGDFDAHLNLGAALQAAGRVGEAIESYRAALRLRPDAHAAHSNIVYAMHFDPVFDAAAIRAEQREWNRRHAAPLPKFVHAPSAADRANPDRRLRIGYISSDFRDHVVGRNVLPLIREHDRAAVEVFCYSDVTAPDALTRQFQSHSTWRDIAGWNDVRVAEQVRADAIDLLVDLTLHMKDNRLRVMARRPAPVQATFAGYPGSTGVEAIQYRLTDPHLEPAGGGDDAFWSERPIRLPHTFWCYEPEADDPPVSMLPALERGFVTFGCLNNFMKVNEPTLRLWANVMRRVENSRLILNVPQGSARARVSAFLERAGVTRDRVAFMPHRARRQYLATYHEIDLALDTFPYNGHTTSLDALWMGVPTVTLAGTLPVARAGVSQLTNVDLPRLIAHDANEFIRIGAELAQDLRSLAGLRENMRDSMRESPLADVAAFARGIEEAYRSMWRAYCAR